LPSAHSKNTQTAAALGLGMCAILHFAIACERIGNLLMYLDRCIDTMKPKQKKLVILKFLK
jgi:hypothetical protein